MSVIVIYNGLRKTIKLNSIHDPIQFVLSNAIEQFKLENENNKFYTLKHKNLTLDLSQPFSWSGLSNNVNLELVETSTTKNSSGNSKKAISNSNGKITNTSKVSIALSVEGGNGYNMTTVAGSLIGSFESSLTLRDVIQQFVNEGKLVAEILSLPLELIYLRSSYKGDSLISTTLNSLGMAGQSIRLKLRLRNDSKPLTHSSVVESNPITKLHNSVPILSTTSIDTQSSIPNPQERVNPIPDGKQGTTADPIAIETKPVVPMDIEPIPLLLPTVTDDRSMVLEGNPIEPEAVEVHPVAPMDIDPIPISTSTQDQMMLPSAPIADDIIPLNFEMMYSVTRVDQSIQNVMNHNFDAVTVPAFVILVKIIQNLIKYPEDEKYQQIKLTNATIRDKLLPVQNIMPLLQSIGFETSKDESQPVLRYPRDVVVNNSDFLFEMEDLFYQSFDELNVEKDQRPAYLDKLSWRMHQETLMKQQEFQIVSFDPYKSHVVRQMPQPRSSSQSSTSATEIQWAQLEKKRAELEGNPSDVQRSTTVLFPRTDGSVAMTMQDYLAESQSKIDNDVNMDEQEEKENRRAAAGALKKFMKKSNGEDDSPPLMTKAVRELQKAQKEKVYSQTLIRIRFPDRVCLQGFFHPRHTIHDVYNWVYESILNPLDRPLDHRFGFELYISPPRQVLDVSLPPMSLLELKLVPASVLLLNWKEDHPHANALKEMGKLGSKGGKDSTVSSETLGSYLKDELLLEASGKESRIDDAAVNSLYPSGIPLTIKNNDSTSIEQIEKLNQSSNSSSKEKKISFMKTLIAPGKKEKKSESETMVNDKKEIIDKKETNGKPKWLKL